MTTLRLEQKYKIGDRGAVYEFDVKLPKLNAPLCTQAQLEDDTETAVLQFAEELQAKYRWVGTVYLTGRSNGWLAIEDKLGGATKATLETINKMVDEAYDGFIRSIEETYGKIHTPPLTVPFMRKRIEFFKEHAGGRVGHAAESAVALARAEVVAENMGWEAEWEEDPDGADTLGDVDPAEVEEILGCVLRDKDREVLASLWGIIDPGRKYRRVVEAELAVEALHNKGLL